MKSHLNFFSPTVPGTGPGDFTATYNSERPSTIVLEWTAIPLEHQNGIITGYVVTTSSEGGEDQELTLEPNLVTFELTGLVPAQYNISISAVTEVGRGPMSTTQVLVLPAGM